MDKAEFIHELSRSLNGSQQDKQEILADYEEHFRMGHAAGKTEDQIASALGEPKGLAKIYNADLLVEKAKTNRSAGNIARAVYAVIGLSFFNLFVVATIFAPLLAIFASLWGTAIAITVTGLALFLGALLSPLVPMLMAGYSATAVAAAAFFGLGLLAMGLLFCLGMVYVTKGLYKITVKYLQFVLKTIKGEKG